MKWSMRIFLVVMVLIFILLFTSLYRQLQTIQSRRGVTATQPQAP
jgi:CHASE3 domain sensor protein